MLIKGVIKRHVKVASHSINHNHLIKNFLTDKMTVHLNLTVIYKDYMIQYVLMIPTKSLCKSF